MAVDTPVPPYGATVAGVLALVPDATLLPDPAPAGRRGVTEAQVTGWLEGLSSRVARKLDGWERLSPDPDPGDGTAVPGDTVSDRDQLVNAARDLIHNGAASYLEAARHPEQAGKSSTTYSAVLWQRFTEGLTELSEWLALRLIRGDASATAATTPSLDYAFPPASFTADLRF